MTVVSSAIELVEHLVRDLVNTTSSYKTLQEKESRLNADLALIQAQLFPLRRENARLSRENHELHIESIRQTEDSTHQMDDFSQQLREMTVKVNELKMLNRAYEEQLRGKDEAVERLREVRRYLSAHSLTISLIIIIALHHRRTKD
jgi:centrosomal protein CEP135